MSLILPSIKFNMESKLMILSIRLWKISSLSSERGKSGILNRNHEYLKMINRISTVKDLEHQLCFLKWSVTLLFFYFLLKMDSFMPLQVGFLSERLLTRAATVRLLIFVDHHVLGDIRSLTELFATHLASYVHVACFFMCHEVCSVGKRFAA